MQQSDINYLYQLLSPWYNAISLIYNRNVSIEFQRMVRMIAEGDNTITLDGNRGEFDFYHDLSVIMNMGNAITAHHDRFEPCKPVEMKHVFACLHSMTLAVEEECSRIPNSVSNKIKDGYLNGRKLGSFFVRQMEC